ncbi:hypothetical protein OV203_14655 [Nannocystis sp. ILAH1]|uniref:hypothetical protein n=1 Tax=unclassified Nannocystis TaxID=2627009 RepID=UPI002271CDC4|nr:MULTISPECIES: hypothetical protein [unclassified Nannocystis]MCY0988370.1 hypothetical protein [Nannocystis sp. ILAH1]MCY1067669.1 hypothetical protein [Nannocystis sp. RBIL2]
MDRLPPAALVFASALALAACRDSGDGSTTIVTTHVTGASTDGTEGSTSSSASSGSDAGSATSPTDDDSSSSSSSTTTSTSTTTTTTTTTTGDETTTTSDASSTTMLDPVEACLAQVDPGDECNACICTDCLMLWDACHADEGCTAIQQCAQTNGCYGDECDAPCAATMNFYGPPDSPSMTAWESLTACLKAACRPLCPW